MKKIIVLLVLGLLISPSASAERHNFFSTYDPVSYSYVYDDTGSTATGDELAVNTFKQKTILVTCPSVGEDIDIRVEGRSADVSTYVILDTDSFNQSSADTEQNFAIDVTEHVDFLRVGIKSNNRTGISAINVDGIFGNIER
jgi:hypothetical protein